MVILRATSILGGQKEDKWMMCSITLSRMQIRVIRKAKGLFGCAIFFYYILLFFIMLKIKITNTEKIYFLKLCLDGLKNLK
jgi:hypothetical protein